jgi:hypothetical protein
LICAGLICGSQSCEGFEHELLARIGAAACVPGMPLGNTNVLGRPGRLHSYNWFALLGACSAI